MRIILFVLFCLALLFIQTVDGSKMRRDDTECTRCCQLCPRSGLYYCRRGCPKECCSKCKRYSCQQWSW